jgi:ornithine cyclodeaminase/alanine dehydrogenase-like protein (mu-crystallin family)
MRLIDAAEIHRLCDWQALVDALARAHEGPMPLVDRSEIHHEQEGARQTYFNLPAWQPGMAMGTKVVTVLPQNPALRPGLPAIQAAYVLCDGATGTPIALLDGTALTYRKTAADSALGARFLARPDASTLLLVGAGGLAPFLALAHRAVRPSLERLFVWNRDHAKAKRLAHDLGGEPVRDLAAAVREADVIACATSSTEPLVRGAWLKPGAHLDLVGAFTPEMREADDEAIRRARIFVDSRQFAIDQPGDLASPLRRGVIARAAIEADLFDLCRNGLPRPLSSEDITLFKNGGGAHLDLFTALFVWRSLAVSA